MQSMRNRRVFITQIAGLAAGGGAAPRADTGNRGVGVEASNDAQPASTMRPRTWDTSWLDSFKGKHKQLFDLMMHTPRPGTLGPAMNYFEVHKELSRMEFPDINVVIGANSSCFPIVASDALWAKFKLGERSSIKDPATGQSATRNIYLHVPAPVSGATVGALQARGALFLMCNNSLQSLATDWSREIGTPAPDLYAEVVAGLHPGVTVVPALTWAVGMLQERGFTLQKL